MPTTATKPYIWRKGPGHPKLFISKLTTGPELGDGPSWEATFLLRGRNGIPSIALLATYGGTGGPVDISPKYYQTKAGQTSAKKKFDAAVKILKELWFCTEDCKRYSPDSWIEIMISDMIGDFENERAWRRKLTRGKLIGFTAEGTPYEWKGDKSVSITDRCAQVVAGGGAKDIVEWFHETIGHPEGVEKVQVLTPVPEDERWKPPEDIACLVCSKMIDRKKHGTGAVACRDGTCDTIMQAVYSDARQIKTGKLERAKASLYNLRPRLGGYGGGGPVGSLLNLAIELAHCDWEDPHVRKRAENAFVRMHQAYVILAEVDDDAPKGEQSYAVMQVPTLKGIDDLVALYPALLAAELAKPDQG